MTPAGQADPFKPVVLRRETPEAGSLELHVLPYGLTVHRLIVTTAGAKEPNDVIVGPEDPRDHKDTGRSFFGPLVGRYANRLPAGKIDATTRDGTRLQLDLPEWGGEGICHHGGPEETTGGDHKGANGGPFDRAVWTSLQPTGSSSSSPQLFSAASSSSTSEHESAIFALESRNGANGFPGDVRLEARFSLLAPSETEAKPATTSAAPSNGWPSSSQDLGTSIGRVKVEYRAKLLSTDVQATPLNVTHHWGFNLTASAEKGGRVDDHTLRLLPGGQQQLTQRLDLDPRGVPTGKLIAAPEGDAHDWSSTRSPSILGRKIGDGLPEDGYDHFYVWGSRSSSEEQHCPVTVLSASDATGGSLSLSFKTNQSGVQLYTANGQPEQGSDAAKDPSTYGGVRKALHRSEGDNNPILEGNTQRSAAFLEFGHPHATFLHHSLQEVAGSDTLLRPSSSSSRQAQHGYENWVELQVWNSKASE